VERVQTRRGWRGTSISPAWHQVFSITQLDEADATMLRLCQSQRQYHRAAKCLCMAASAVYIFDRGFDFAKRIFRHVTTDDDADRAREIDFRNSLLASRVSSFACKCLRITIERKDVLASGDVSMRGKNYRIRGTTVTLLSKIMDGCVTFGSSRERAASSDEKYLRCEKSLALPKTQPVFRVLHFIMYVKRGQDALRSRLLPLLTSMVLSCAFSRETSMRNVCMYI